MKLEDQVVNLELARTLKQFGVKQNAFWSWFDTVDRDDIPRLNRTNDNCPTCCLPKQSFEEQYSAFSVAELGAMLPHGFGISTLKSGEFVPWWTNEGIDFGAFIALLENFKGLKTEADARATLLIFLIKRELVKL